MNDLTNSQKRILGIAYGVNQLTLGKVKSLFTSKNADLSQKKYEGVSDLQWPLAAHLIDELAFTQYKHSVIFPDLRIAHDDAYFTLLDNKGENVKKCVIDDINNLIDRDYLEESAGGMVFPRWGYILTEPGYQIGQNYQEDVTPFQVLRSGIYVAILDSHDEKIHLFDKLKQSNMDLNEFLTWFNLHCPRGIVLPKIVDDFCDEFNIKHVPHKFVDYIIRHSSSMNKKQITEVVR